MNGLIKICHIIASVLVVKVGSVKAIELQTKGRHKSGEGGRDIFFQNR